MHQPQLDPRRLAHALNPPLHLQYIHALLHHAKSGRIPSHASSDASSMSFCATHSRYSNYFSFHPVQSSAHPYPYPYASA
ncbi:hypothetical protein V8C44DRAFT_332570 [Trichoderma aethiopicum]